MTEPSLVIRVMNDYNSLLEARDYVVIHEMANKWIRVEKGVESDMENLAREIERRTQAGEYVTQQMIYDMDTYKITQYHLAKEIDKYNHKFAEPYIENLQREYGMLGIQASNDYMLATYREFAASAPFWEKVNNRAVEAMVGLSQDYSPLYKLLYQAYPLSSSAILDSMMNSIARGYGVGKMVEDMTKASEMGLNRAILIARTESARVYRQASVMQYRKSGVCGGFYRIVKKPTACISCLALDGEYFDAAEDLYDHPRGKCGTIPAIIGMPKPKWQTGQDWFETLSDAEQQKIMGREAWDLWKTHKFPLDYMSSIRKNTVWGNSPRKTTLDELYKKLGIQRPKGGVSYRPPRPAPRIPPVAPPPTTPATPKPPIKNRRPGRYTGRLEGYDKQMNELFDICDAHGIKVKYDMQIDGANIQGLIDALRDVKGIYPKTLDRIETLALNTKQPYYDRKKNKSVVAYWWDIKKTLSVNPKYMTDNLNFKNVMQYMSQTGWNSPGIPMGKEVQYLFTHELGHTLDHQLLFDTGLMWDKNGKSIYQNFKTDIKGLSNSDYGHHNKWEAFAEAFAAYRICPKNEWFQATYRTILFLQDVGVIP